MNNDNLINLGNVFLTGKDALKEICDTLSDIVISDVVEELNKYGIKIKDMSSEFRDTEDILNELNNKYSKEI